MTATERHDVGETPGTRRVKCIGRLRSSRHCGGASRGFAQRNGANRQYSRGGSQSGR